VDRKALLGLQHGLPLADKDGVLLLVQVHAERQHAERQHAERQHAERQHAERPGSESLLPLEDVSGWGCQNRAFEDYYPHLPLVLLSLVLLYFAFPSQLLLLLLKVTHHTYHVSFFYPFCFSAFSSSFCVFLFYVVCEFLLHLILTVVCFYSLYIPNIIIF
jgi:hypothetical protein